MTELFEVISGEEFERSGATTLEATARYGGERTAVSVAPDDLTYCAFCKGYYNEYHFGDIDEGSEEFVASG